MEKEYNLILNKEELTIFLHLAYIDLLVVKDIIKRHKKDDRDKPDNVKPFWEKQIKDLTIYKNSLKKIIRNIKSKEKYFKEDYKKLRERRFNAYDNKKKR